MSFTEGSYENALMALFENMDYQHLYGPDIKRDYYIPFYEEQVLNSLSAINPDKPLAAIHEAIAKLKDINTGSLTQKNEIFMDIFNMVSKSPITMDKNNGMNLFI